jgi:CheY-like chemotaxis protein
LAKPSLLLVDADLRSLRVLEVSLKKAGFMVTTAVSGADALDKVDLAHPELVISDTHMPEMDGFELCRRLKTSTAWAEVPFIFLTTHSAVEDKIRGLELGVEDYLTKPIYLKEILTRVRILLQKREQKALQEKRDAKTKFSGLLSDMAVVDLIQTVEISRKSGVIHFASGEQRAAIFFRNGKVIDAEHGRLASADAVYRLLLWTDGTFEVEFKNVRRKESIALSSQGLLMEGMRRVDEWGRLLEQLPALETVLEVVSSELAARIGELPDEANGLLRLIDGRRSIMQLVDDWGVGDLPALEVIARMYFQGLLAPVERVDVAPMDEAKERALVGWLETATTGSVTRRHVRPSQVILPPRDVPVPTIDAPFGEPAEAPPNLKPESTIRAGGATPPGARTTTLRAEPEDEGRVPSIDPLAAIRPAMSTPAAEDTRIDGAQIEAEAPAALGLPRTPSQEMAAMIEPRRSGELAAVEPALRRRSSKELTAVPARRPAEDPLAAEEWPAERHPSSPERAAIPQAPGSEPLSDRAALNALIAQTASGSASETGRDGAAPLTPLDEDATPRVGPPRALAEATGLGDAIAVPAPVNDDGSGRQELLAEAEAEATHEPGPSTAGPGDLTTRVNGEATPSRHTDDENTSRANPPPVAVGDALARMRLVRVRRGSSAKAAQEASQEASPGSDARTGGARRSSTPLPEPMPDYSSDPTPLPPPSRHDDDHPRRFSSEGADRREVSGIFSASSGERVVSAPHPASVVTILPTAEPPLREGSERGGSRPVETRPAPAAEPGAGRWMLWAGVAAIVAAGLFLLTSHPSSSSSSSPSAPSPSSGTGVVLGDAGPPPADAALPALIPDAALPAVLPDARALPGHQLATPAAPTEHGHEAAVADDDPRALLKQARRFKGSGHSDEALAVVDQVLAKDPTSIEGRLLRAEIMIDRGQRAAALQLVETVLADKPRSGDAWMLKGLIHYDQGESVKARAAFEKYLEIRPNGRRADDVRVMLESL